MESQLIATGQPAAAVVANTAGLSWRAWRGWLSTLGSRMLASGDRLVIGFVMLGILARAVRYFLRFPLWEDECFLLVSLSERGYAALAQPLDYHQVAPLLFLWCQRALIDLFGFNELSARLVPFLCSIMSLLLFVRLARKLLQGTSVVLAVAIFAVAYPCIRYAAEAKPYGCDMFVALVLVSLILHWQAQPSRTAGLWALCAVIPLAVGFSYPAVFIAGGVSLFALWSLVSNRESRGWIAWFVYNGLLLGSFQGWFVLATQRQSSAELTWMRNCWQDTFPPLHGIWGFVSWLGVTHVSEIFSYPVGGERGASALTAICFFVGLVTFWRWKRRGLLVLFLVPAGLNFIAAALQRYPYGGHVRFGLYFAPLVCLTAGLGGAMLLAAISRRRNSRSPIAITLVVLALIATGSIIRDVWHPYKTQSDLRARAFAQWFWFNAEFDGEVACLKSDFGREFSPQAGHELSWLAMYQCNQRIYSPRHHNGAPPDFQRVTQEWPLRCVEYRASFYDYDQEKLDAWLAEMQTDYRLVSQDTYAFPRYGKRERNLTTVDYLDVFKFVPRDRTARGSGNSEGDSPSAL
jgi:4-amino-4-deoxy-L-arabinose transferase-like glycosyltransferase